ncbi:aminoglycoside phosphotransferase family protein [Paenibacillus sp. FSL R5-0407]|uniref:aminoglycoside phosphotransferase family protein n=1 Tax=Paenibacillus sp. FSL R5-0407 TaxID=2975320 RepID=UPI0030F777EC
MTDDSFKGITWRGRCGDFHTLISEAELKQISPMPSGLEADVYKISTTTADLVLKVWNRDSKPDIAKQYELLQGLFNQGIPLSEPLGWGIDADNNQVLLTGYGGTPVAKLNKLKLETLADILTGIHSVPIESLPSPEALPKYHFVSYFFPSIDGHADIKEILLPLVEDSQVGQYRLIHGDYNLGNILEMNGRFTIIDWTNIQLGDPRYDAAWSIFLMRIYASERNGSLYRSFLLAKNTYLGGDMERFEAIACLRWILLNRIAGLPMGKNTLAVVRAIVKNNVYLDEKLL